MTLVRRRGEVAPGAVAAGLALLTVLAFLPSLECGFVAFDDPRTVPQYRLVLDGLSAEGVAWAFRQTDFFGHWVPLTVLSHMLDWELYGENARGHHLTSLLLHGAAVGLVFLLWQRGTGHTWPAAAVAALWGVHPLRVEPVVWLAGRKDLLSACLGLAALLAYVDWTRRPSARRYALIVVLFLLALLGKAIVTTLPAAMLLLDVWPLDRLRLPDGGSIGQRFSGFCRAVWPRLREKLPLLAMSLAAGAFAVAAAHGGGAMPDLAAHPLPSRLAVAALAVPRYLLATAWPQSLAAFYPLAIDVPWGRAAMAALFVVAATGGALAGFRRWPWIPCGWLWFLCLLAPVAGLAQAGEQSHADRYTYLPGIGLAVAVVWTLGATIRRPSARWVAAVLVGAIVVAWAAVTRAQIATWSDSSALFERMLAVEPDNPTAHVNLGLQRAAEGRLEEAIAHYRRAAELQPGVAGTHSNLGSALMRRGDRDGARAAFERAIRLDPKLAQAHFNLAVLLADDGEPALAVGHLARTVTLQPAYEPAWRGLEALLGEPGVAREARPYLEALLREDPNSTELRRVAALAAEPGVSPPRRRPSP